MTRKALLVAVEDYQGLAQDLRAPVKEMGEWKKLLLSRDYGFEQVTTLADAQATRTAVLDELETLLRGAQPHDQLVFGFFGHGTTARGWRTRTQLNDQVEQALVVYPNGERDLQNAVITESDLARIFNEEKPPLGTDIVLVIESCFAGRFYPYPPLMTGRVFSRGRSHRKIEAIPLFAPSPIDSSDLAHLQSVVPFGSFAARRLSQPIEKPVLVAATESDKRAYEVRTPRESRLLFSEKALSLLKAERLSFRELIDALNPLDPELKQTATLVGNEDRWDEQFPGESDESRSDAIVIENAQPRRAAPRSVTASTTLAAAYSFDIRILGLCCFVKAVNPETDPYRARLVLPFDDLASGPRRHFAFVEVARDDMDGDPTGDAPTKKYKRTQDNSGVEYWRWHLDGQRITILNGDRTQEIVKSDAFRRRVPRMTLLNPDLNSRPREECFADVAQRDLFAALVDLPSGTVTTGQLDEGETVFRRPSGPPNTWGPERTPQTVVFTAAITTPTTALVIPATAITGEITIPLKAGSSILIGNAREEDITGPGSTDTPSEQFALLYKLSHFAPNNAPLPVPALVPIDSCSPTDWP